MKKRRLTKRIICLGLVFLLSINSFAAVVSDNDGSAFITKSEFDTLKSNFQAQIDSYNQSIDSKIDGAIASYLAGIKLATQINYAVPNNRYYDIQFRNQLPYKVATSYDSGGTSTSNYWIEDFYGHRQDLSECNCTSNKSGYSPLGWGYSDIGWFQMGFKWMCNRYDGTNADTMGHGIAFKIGQYRLPTDASSLSGGVTTGVWSARSAPGYQSLICTVTPMGANKYVARYLCPGLNWYWFTSQEDYAPNGDLADSSMNVMVNDSQNWDYKGSYSGITRSYTVTPPKGYALAIRWYYNSSSYYHLLYPSKFWSLKFTHAEGVDKNPTSVAKPATQYPKICPDINSVRDVRKLMLIWSENPHYNCGYEVNRLNENFTGVTGSFEPFKYGDATMTKIPNIVAISSDYSKDTPVRPGEYDVVPSGNTDSNWPMRDNLPSGRGDKHWDLYVPACSVKDKLTNYYNSWLNDVGINQKIGEGLYMWSMSQKGTLKVKGNITVSTGSKNTCKLYFDKNPCPSSASACVGFDMASGTGKSLGLAPDSSGNFEYSFNVNNGDKVYFWISPESRNSSIQNANDTRYAQLTNIEGVLTIDNG